MAIPSQKLKYVHEFLGRLKIPDEKIRKIKAMNVVERTRTPIPAKIFKKKLTDKDYYHTLLLELVRESGHKNYLIVFIRPKSDFDEKGDGKPYIMKGNMLGEDTWSTDEDEETLRGPRKYYEDNSDENTDDNDGEDTGEEADEAIDEDGDQLVHEDNDQCADDSDDADDLADDERDDQVPDGHYDSTSEDLAYFTADENIDSDD